MRKNLFLGFFAVLTFAVSVFSQTKTPVKKNERPNAESEKSVKETSQKQNSNTISEVRETSYRYEFSQPNFLVKKIVIEHDETGRGKISFEKKDAEETITDPIQLTSVSLDKINKFLETLNFSDSSEDYQSPMRHYGHLGENEITFTKNGKTRTAKYNWSENVTARELAQEYRKIGEQAVWLFDVETARQIRPLDTPGLMDRLDSLLRRGELSDPPQLLPVLKKISNDERFPLMARNHALRIIKTIEKK